MSATTTLYDDTGDGTGAEIITQRKRRDTGQWMIQFTPNSAPSTVTIKLQVQLRDDFSGFATVKTVTESELGSTAGVKYFHETVPLGAKMRCVVSNNDDAANAILVVLQE